MKKRNNRYSLEFKRQIIEEAKEIGNSALIARKYDLVQSTVNRWVRESKQPNKNANSINYTNYKNIDDIINENEKLKKIVGEKELEIATLRNYFQKRIDNNN